MQEFIVLIKFVVPNSSIFLSACIVLCAFERMEDNTAYIRSLEKQLDGICVHSKYVLDIKVAESI